MNLAGFRNLSTLVIRRTHEQIMQQCKQLPQDEQLPGVQWMAEQWMIVTCQMLRDLHRATALYDVSELEQVEQRIATEVSKLQKELESWRA